MKKIAVIGAGTMGNGIAHTFAQKNYQVTLIDVSEQSLEKALSTISKNLDRMVSKDKISESEKTVIIYESPHRLKKLLNELKKFCGGKRQIQIFRELTKKYEEQIGSNIDMVSDYFEKKDIIGEITIVINKKDNIGNSSFNEYLIKKELNELVNAGLTLSAASKYLAKKNNIKKSLIYNLY